MKHSSFPFIIYSSDQPFTELVWLICLILKLAELTFSLFQSWWLLVSPGRWSMLKLRTLGLNLRDFLHFLR